MYRDNRNVEGYPDPTAYDAIENIDSKARAKKVISDILVLLEANDFELVERIKIYDRKAGRLYK